MNSVADVGRNGRKPTRLAYCGSTVV